MALSGRINGSVTNNAKYFSFYATWSAVQSISGNYSDVTVNTYWSTNDEWQEFDTVASRNASITINGETTSISKVFKVYWREIGTTYLIQTATTRVYHNDDGSKSITISARANGRASSYGTSTTSASSGDNTLSGTVTLDTIARVSQPSCVTWPEHTQNVGEFGDEISIHMNRKSSSFTHTVRYQFGSQSGTIATGVENGVKWVIPLTLMNLIPNSTKGSGTIYVDTYNGSTKLGTKYCGFTATVPASVKPICSISVSDPTGHATTYGAYVKGLSKFAVTVTPTLAYKSAIKTYNTTANGSKYTTASFTTGVLTSYGTLNVSTTVVDSRDRSATASKNLTVLNYNAPSITVLTVRRCNADGTANEQGGYVQVTFSATVTALNNKNTATYTLKYKKSTESTFTEVTISAIQNSYNVTNHTYVFEADTGNSYDVEVQVADNHDVSSRSTSASTAFTLMHWNAEGTGMGIGKVAEKANTLQIGLDVEFIGKVKGTIFDAIYPVGSIYMAYNHTDPSTLFGGTWERLTGGFLWASQDGDTIGQTGGEKTHTLTVDELPSHNHGGTYTNAGSATKTHAWLASGGSSMAYDTVNTGGGQAHNNMPPYIQVSIWRRTA